MPRTERYLHDGRLDNRAFAIRIDPATVAMLARQATARIPAQYFVGTAQHESNFAANEIDTEESGYVSKGLYQIAEDEAAPIMHGANLCDPVIATLVFARLQERRLDAILAHVPNAKQPDVWAYLAIAHNEGLGTWAADGKGALGTICRNGVNWPGYKARNYGRPICDYGDDVISGGARWLQIVH